MLQRVKHAVPSNDWFHSVYPGSRHECVFSPPTLGKLGSCAVIWPLANIKPRISAISKSRGNVLKEDNHFAQEASKKRAVLYTQPWIYVLSCTVTLNLLWNFKWFIIRSESKYIFRAVDILLFSVSEKIGLQKLQLYITRCINMPNFVRPIFNIRNYAHKLHSRQVSTVDDW